jgi:hypothetical protein
MDSTGKPMKGYVYVDPAGFESDSNLRKWVDLCIRFNASPTQMKHRGATLPRLQ